METLTPDEKNFLLSLSTPQKIQDYLESIPFNHEEHGETCRSAKEVLKNKTAHCIEGAMLASLALVLQKRRPLIMSLMVIEKDYDHVVALFKEGGHWGAISKTNHAVLGYRDPVYKTIRELAMSYFHEYFLLKGGQKTLRGYSRPINLNRFGTTWISSKDNLFTLAEAVANAPYSPVIPKGNEHLIRKATPLEISSASLSQDSKE